MPRNGAGSYSLPTGNPVVTGTAISSTVQNTTMTDIGTALTQSIAKDGQTTPSANLPMGSFRHTGVGNGVARTDYPSIGQVQDSSFMWCGTATGTANALLLVPTPIIPAIVAGQRFVFKSGAAPNSGATTVSISTLPTIAVQVNGAACVGGEIEADNWYEVIVDASTTSCQLNKIGLATLLELGIGLSSKVKGLIGAPNAATPLTKYDVSADEVVLRRALGGTVIRFLGGTITCDLELAGPVVNGRDQAAAFTAGSWVYIYFIWNGTTLATIASLRYIATAASPIMPTGYTHWALAAVVRWNASSNIIPVLTKGSNAVYDLGSAGVSRVLSANAATTFTALSLAGFVPPNALMARLNYYLSFVHNVANVEFSASSRPTGSAATGFIVASAVQQVVGNTTTGFNVLDVPLGTSQQIDYKLSSAPATSGGLTIEVVGFKIPNGDA